MTTSHTNSISDVIRMVDPFEFLSGPVRSSAGNPSGDVASYETCPTKRSGRRTKAEIEQMTAPQNVKKGRSQTKKKQALSRPSKSTFSRTTFRTKRDMDFFSARELVTQTGHDEEEWPLVFLKEAIDNALDACEEADIPPTINVTTNASGIAVTDNGPV